MPAGAAVKLLLVDYGSLFRMAWHASEGQEVSAAYEKTVAKVRWLSAQHDRTVIACDAPPYARKDLSPEYKAGREPPTPAMIEQGRRTVERLAADGHLVWRVKGQEADDVIASSVAWALLNAVGEVTIASSDHDLLQLVDDDAKVSQYSFAAEKTYRVADVVEKFGVHPQDFADFKALVGDKSDNIAGCPGCGPKTAAKWLMEYGHLKAIEEAAVAGKLEPKKVGENMAASVEQVRVARELVTLRTDLQLPFGDIYKPATVKPLVETEELDRESADVTDQEVDEMISRPESDKPFEPQLVPKSEPPKAAEAGAAPALREVPAPTAIVPAPKEWAMQLEPRDSSGAIQLSKYLFNSRLYSRYPSSEAILAVLLRGRALGMDATLALDSFHIVEGRPTMHADLIEALVLRSGKAEYFECVETTNRKAVYETKRHGARRPLRIEFTIEDACDAGLVDRNQQGKDGFRGISRSGKPSNWDKYRATMLRHRCKTQLARAVYPDVTLGLYSPDELDGETSVIDAEYEVAQ